MAIELAIGYRVKPAFPGAAALVQDAGADPLADRPPIPQGVIDWPVGAGDPATDVDGPAPFRRPFRATPLARPMKTPAAFLEALVVALLFAAMVAGLALRVGPVIEQAVAGENAPRKVATVETRVISLSPVEPSQRLAQRTEAR